MIRCVVFVIVLLVPAFARGQEPVKQCIEGKPDHCAQPVKAGEPVPFDGQLFTPKLALDYAEKVHSFDERLDAEMSRMQGRQAITVESLQRLRVIDAMAVKEREAILKRALDDAGPAFYERPAFVIPVTAVIVTAAILGAVALSAELGQAVWAR